MQLTSSRSSGKWPGLANRTGGWGVGGTWDPLPVLRLRQVRASRGAAPRCSESARARGQVQPGMPQYFRLRSDRAQRAGLRPPRPRAALTRAPGARAEGPRAKRAEEAGPRAWARPLSRGRGGGGGASECFLASCGYTCFGGLFSYLGHTVSGRAALLRGDAHVPLKMLGMEIADVSLRRFRG